jgi:hypothetical protein
VCCLQCYIDAKAEQCDDALCDRMVVSIQGGLYGALAYTDKKGLAGSVALEETCNGDEPDFGYGSKKAAKNGAAKKGAANNGAANNGAAKNGAAKDGAAKNGAAKKKPMQVFPKVTLPGVGKKGKDSQPIDQLLEYILGFAYKYLVRDGHSNDNHDDPGKDDLVDAPVVDEPAEAKIANDQATSKRLYKGVAAIISGPFYVTSTHSGMIEETGLFEFALASYGDRKVASPANRWPMVRAGAAKLRFTRQHEADYAPKAGSA